MRGSDDPHRPAAVLAGLDVDPEHAFEALCPGHGTALVRFSAIRIGLPLPAAPGRGDLRTIATVWCEHTMEATNLDRWC